MNEPKCVCVFIVVFFYLFYWWIWFFIMSQARWQRDPFLVGNAEEKRERVPSTVSPTVSPSVNQWINSFVRWRHNSTMSQYIWHSQGGAKVSEFQKKGWKLLYFVVEVVLDCMGHHRYHHRFWASPGGRKTSKDNARLLQSIQSSLDDNVATRQKLPKTSFHQNILVTIMNPKTKSHDPKGNSLMTSKGTHSWLQRKLRTPKETHESKGKLMNSKETHESKGNSGLQRKLTNEPKGNSWIMQQRLVLPLPKQVFFIKPEKKAQGTQNETFLGVSSE